MKLMTLNMWQGRLEKVLLKHLENLDIDFACTQEAVDCEGGTAGLATTYQKVGKSLNLNNHYFSPLIHTKFGGKDIEFGNAIYANQPFLLTENIFTRGTYEKNFDLDNGDYNVRAFQHVEMQLGSKRLHLINHHGHHIDAHKLGDEETFRQIKQIAEYVNTLKGAVVVCGDFNLSPESESINVLSSSLRNLSEEYSLKTTRSHLTNKNEVCDYIFVNKNISVNNFHMDEEIISDHNALILDFEIN